MRLPIGETLLAGALVACGGSTDGDEVAIIPGGSNSIFGSVPKAPPSQGAVAFSIKPPASAPSGTTCPTSAFTTSIPDTSSIPSERLDEDNYQHKIVDGKEGAAFSCQVAAEQDGWVFEGNAQLGGRALRIEGGTLSQERTGAATITLTDSSNLPQALKSSEPCVIDAMRGSGNQFQVKPGSMWAQFSCAAVVALPSDFCGADGFFVLENCTLD